VKISEPMPRPRDNGTPADYVNNELADWFDKMNLDKGPLRQLSEHLTNVVRRNADELFEQRLDMALRRQNYSSHRDRLNLHASVNEIYMGEEDTTDEDDRFVEPIRSYTNTASFRNSPSGMRTFSANHFACWYCGDTDCSASTCPTARHDENTGVIQYSFQLGHIRFPLEDRLLPPPLMRNSKNMVPYRKLAVLWISLYPQSQTCTCSAFRNLKAEQKAEY
jgi:hypothetical protein